VSIENFSIVLIGLGVLIALLALAYVVRRAFGRGSGEMGGWEVAGAHRIIWAIARTTLSEGLRTRVASGFVILIVAAVPFFYFSAEGDGTTTGRVQMFMSYSLGFCGFLLSLLAILFACRSLSQEIAGRQIFGIVSKPVPRWQVIVGKFTGVMAMIVLLMCYVGVTTYAGTMLLVGQFKSNLKAEMISYGSLSPEQADAAVASLDGVRGEGRRGADSPIIDAMARATGLSKEDAVTTLLRLPEETRADLRRFDELRRQILLARASIGPEVPEKQIREEVERRFAKMREEGTLPPNLSDREIREELNKQMFGMYCTITTNELRAWTLKGPPPTKEQDRIMSLRFKLTVPEMTPAAVHPVTGEQLEENTLLAVWYIGDPQSAHFYEHIEAIPTGAVQEIEFPGKAVQADGTITIAFLNIDPRGADVVIDLEKGALEVLYVVGSFELNLLMGCMAMLIPIACLAAFGVCASTFLSFPVGSLVVMCLFLISASMGFIKDAMAITEDYIAEKPTTEQEVRTVVIGAMEWLLSIGDIAVTNDLMEGRAIGWARLWGETWRYMLLKTGITLAIAVLVFRRRELAAIIV